MESSSVCDSSESDLRASCGARAADGRAGVVKAGVLPYAMVAPAGVAGDTSTGAAVVSTGRPDAAASRAPENSRSDENRSAGRLLNARRNTCSTVGGRPGTRGASGCGSRLMIWYRSAATSSATNGPRPSSISQAMQAKAHWSSAVIDLIDHAGGLLGRHVIRRAHDRRRVGQLRARRLHL